MYVYICQYHNMVLTVRKLKKNWLERYHNNHDGLVKFDIPRKDQDELEGINGNTLEWSFTT